MTPTVTDRLQVLREKAIKGTLTLNEMREVTQIAKGSKLIQKDITDAEARIRAALSVKLTEFRRKKKLSQRDMLMQTGIHGCFISRVESCREDLRLSVLLKIANAIELDVVISFTKRK